MAKDPQSILDELLKSFNMDIPKMEEQKKHLESMYKTIKEQAFPLSQNTINIDGTDCVIQLFTDKIIIIPSDKDIKNLNMSLNSYKRLTKWEMVKSIFK
jgi:hypothetical protein